MGITSKNQLMLCGRLISPPVFSHIGFDEKYFTFTVETHRASGTRDRINVLACESQLTECEPYTGDYVEISGELRTYNYKNESGSHLGIFAFVKALTPSEYCNCNEILLQGTICRRPVYRKTPLGREICDLMLAVNHSFNRSYYIPCIIWGKNALYTRDVPVGAALEIVGRVQSREYTKLCNEKQITKTAYEVSVSTICLI